jgi:hypothetical protein
MKMAAACQSAIVVSCWLVLTLIVATALAIGDWPANQEGGKTQVSSSRVVNTRKGSLRGLYQAFDDKSLAAVELFLGVPYASPPLGSLRFMPPVTVSPWRGIRQADRYSPVCPQRFPDLSNETEALKRMPRGRLETLKKLVPMLTNQSEDCLYLNIFTPYSSKNPNIIDPSPSQISQYIKTASFNRPNPPAFVVVLFFKRLFNAIKQLAMIRVRFQTPIHDTNSQNCKKGTKRDI